MPKTPGTIMGVKSKWAVVIVLVVFVSVWYYLKHRSTGIATQTQSTPQVAPTGQPDSTGGVPQAPDLSALLDMFAQQNAVIGDLSANVGSLASSYSQPSGYYSAPAAVPSTTSYTYNYTGASPPVQEGAVNNPAASPIKNVGASLASGVDKSFSFPSVTSTPTVGATGAGTNIGGISWVPGAFTSTYAGKSTPFIAQ